MRRAIRKGHFYKSSVSGHMIWRRTHVYRNPRAKPESPFRQTRWRRQPRVTKREIEENKKADDVVRRIEDDLISRGVSERVASFVGFDDNLKTWVSDLIVRDFGFVANAVHDFNHTEASGFFSERKKKKSFREGSSKWLRKELDEDTQNGLPIDGHSGDPVSVKEIKQSLKEISTPALIAKYDSTCSEMLYGLHAESNTFSTSWELLAGGYTIRMLGEELLLRVADVDTDAMSFVADRPDFVWELAKKERETFGVNRLRPEKLLTAEEVMTYTGCDEDELVVYVWGEMLEGRVPADSQPKPFGWEKFSYGAEVTLESMSEQDKSNVHKLMYPGWSVLQLKDAT